MIRLVDPVLCPTLPIEERSRLGSNAQQLSVKGMMAAQIELYGLNLAMDLIH